ncbi:MAG: dihydropteroate synthase [Pseudomonadota bacterium]|jgi:dihydropteroate synthase
MSLTWQTTRFNLDLSRPQVMGIVNVTPDSFSDGGHHVGSQQALAHARRLLDEGADILDIGGESSRPGAPVLTVDEEWGRIAAVLQELVRWQVPVSVDTCKPEVMRRALGLGVDIVNDIHALEAPGALEAVSAHGACGVCLMHMVGVPETMQQQARYDDVVETVADYLVGRAHQVTQAGVARGRICLDPGIGFGKLPAHNLALLRRQSAIVASGYPVLAGWSRKSTLGQVTGRDVAGRLPASLAAALMAVQRGAHVVRVHDVAATVDVIKVWQAVEAPNFEGSAP